MTEAELNRLDQLWDKTSLTLEELRERQHLNSQFYKTFRSHVTWEDYFDDQQVLNEKY